jgi:hypothetical protein
LKFCNIRYDRFQFKSIEEGCNNKEEKAALKEKKEDFEKDEEEKENCGGGGGKLRRSESLNKQENKKEGSNKARRTESLKRTDSLTKTEKTESNMNRRRGLDGGAGGKGYKMKRKTGPSHERSIKRRHTVGGTKDFDRTNWLDNRAREAAEEELFKRERRTSSPDLTNVRGGVLTEVVIRPLSLPTGTTSQPLESHI